MSYNPDKIKKIVLLGVQGENLATKIEFNMSSWSELYPSGAYSLILKRPGDELPYAVNTSYNSETKILTWFVSSIDTAYEGEGQAEIICIEGEIIDKSFIFDIEIAPCLDPTGDVPDPLEDWYQRMLEVEQNTKEYRDDAQQAASDAKDAKDLALEYKLSAQQSAEQAAASASDIEDLTVSIHLLPVDSEPTVEKTKQPGQPYNLDFGLPKANINYVSFRVDTSTGQLVAYIPEDYVGPVFSINNNGYLEVTINA